MTHIFPRTLSSPVSALGILASLALAQPGRAQTLTQYSLPNPGNGFAFDAPVQGRDGNLYGLFGNNAPSIYVSTPGGSITSQFVGGVVNGQQTYVCYTGMILGRDGNFYGTCEMVGAGTQDIAFRFTPGVDGGQGTFTPFAVITPNANNGTRYPSKLLEASDGNFYGTTYGGEGLVGSVFRITPAGVVTTLATLSNTGGPYYPTGPLIQIANGRLYGTSYGGSNICCGNGTIFTVTTKGKVSTFYNFDGTNGVAGPEGGVIQAKDGSFYGMTHDGGAYGYGSIYKVSKTRVLTDLHDVNLTNDGAAYPGYGLVQATDGNLYGTLNGCESGGCGTGALFEMTTAGVFTPLFLISAPPGGCPAMPTGCIPNSGNIEHTSGTLYGVLQQGGTNFAGVLYDETTSPALKPNVILQEPSGAPGATVDVLGQGFSNARKVYFGKVPASFTVVSDTYLTAVVPASAKSAYVAVNEPGVRLTSQQRFSVK